MWKITQGPFCVQYGQIPLTSKILHSRRDWRDWQLSGMHMGNIYMTNIYRWEENIGRWIVKKHKGGRKGSHKLNSDTAAVWVQLPNCLPNLRQFCLCTKCHFKSFCLCWSYYNPHWKHVFFICVGDLWLGAVKEGDQKDSRFALLDPIQSIIDRLTGSSRGPKRYLPKEKWITKRGLPNWPLARSRETRGG